MGAQARIGNNKPKNPLLYAMFTLAVLLEVSCNSTPIPQSPSQTPAVTQTLTTTERVLPTQTSKPTQPPTPTLDFNSAVFNPRNVEELQAFVIFQLNQGKGIDTINDAFEDSEGRRNAWLDGRAADFDGDQEQELFLTGSMYIPDPGQSENIFWFAKKIDGYYQEVYSLQETASYAAGIQLVGELNNDQRPDVVFTRALPGNGTNANLFIARFESPKFVIQKVMEISLIIDEIQVDTQMNNGMKNLLITGYQPGWGSSGPGRTVEETYSFSGKEYDLLQTRYLPDNYRIHVLQDAQIAYNAGDEKLAVKLWKQAAYDEELINFPSMWIEDDRPEIYQPAFALYRLYTYHLSINDEDSVRKYRSELNNKYPEGRPGGEFNKLATEAKRQLDASRKASTVCKGIYEFLNSTPEYVDFLMQHWWWGDHNNDIIDFCPLRR